MFGRRLWVGFQITATLVLLSVLFRDFEWKRLTDVLSTLPISFYLGSLSIIGAGQLLYALKWDLALRALGSSVPFRPLAEFYFVGLFFNNFLPTAVGGDAARVYYLGRTRGYGFAAASVALDRLYGFFAITVWAATLAWSLRLDGDAAQLLRSVLTAGCLAFVAAIGMLLAFPADAVNWLAGKLPACATRTASTARRTLQWRRMLRSRPGIPVAIMAIVLVYYSALAFLYQRFFLLAADLRVPFTVTLAIVLSIGILSNAPIAVNGIGLREQLHYLLFAELGVSKELAVGASLVIFAQTVTLSLVGYLIWVRWRLVADPAPGADR